MNKNHYIDKKQFHSAFVEWYEQLKQNENAPMPKFIAECFIKMADNIARKHNWNTYTWLDDMKGNAILNCVKYAKRYDIEHNSDPFSYFTSAVNNIFLQTREKNMREIEKIDMFKTQSLQLYHTDRNSNEGVYLTNIEDLKAFGDILALDKEQCNQLSAYSTNEKPEETIDDILSKEINNFNRSDIVDDLESETDDESAD